MKLRIIKEYKTEKKIISFFRCLKKIFFFVKKKKIKTILDMDAKKSATKILIARDKVWKIHIILKFYHLNQFFLWNYIIIGTLYFFLIYRIIYYNEFIHFKIFTIIFLFLGY